MTRNIGYPGALSGDSFMPHRVYLAVPGVNFCWGTVTGVINSTRSHVAIPKQMGFGFSGVEDFNMLWTDAHNLYEKGEITHFAMLHGDITPDPEQRWLDILLEEADKHNATLVSAVSPIKDHRGITSSGICDINDRWTPWRRFTIRELQRLPETFDNVAAGYPDRPLLHNTGLFVCDLRKQVFRTANERGELDLYFQFPTCSIRGSDGAWTHQRESEDWLLSRDLWNRGVRDTFITSRVKLTHHGKMNFTNNGDWGQFVDGDENTANKWRAELDKLPLRMLQMIDFEIGPGCNLGEEHAQCPNKSPERYASLNTSRQLQDDEIIAAAVQAYKELGFTGAIGWHYYNEPLVYEPRMFRLMERIKEQVGTARFILWTNGMLIPEDCDKYSMFSEIIISVYNDDGRRGCERLKAKGINSKWIQDAAASFDTRLENTDPVIGNISPCLRPFVEFIVDAFGNTHLCCYDWRGKGTLGNLHEVPFATLAARWRDMLPEIAGTKMGERAPQVCRSCPHRWDKYQVHDEAIVSRARRFREALAK